MRNPFLVKTVFAAFCWAFVGWLLLGGAGFADDAARIPVCMIVDDPAPFINMRSLKDTNVCHEIPTSFYIEFGQWAARSGVKGKFSVVPCLGGIKPIDGSLGEIPGHTREERLAWIAMVR